MATGLRTFTRAEVKGSQGDGPLYTIIDNKVYDISEFIPDHPGGAVIMTHIGRDGTDAFYSFHPESSQETLSNYYVGDLAPEDCLDQQEDDFIREIRELKREFERLGYFESDKLYYLFKATSTLALWGVSIYLLARHGDSIGAHIASALIMGLFWQQCGWLSHDFLHHQVFKNRSFNDMVGDFFGGVCLGFSPAWWKNKQNTHHAAPNVHGEDPDIDTVPILAWSNHALEFFADVPDDELAIAMGKFMIGNQSFLIFPVMVFAKLSWAMQSILFILPNGQKGLPRNARVPVGILEQLSVGLHWTWYLGLLFLFVKTPLRIALYLFLSQGGCGLLLALVFVLNHNGMPVVTEQEGSKMDFYSLQIITGRDVKPSWIVTWFTGGLNYQIEHHLFPALPRHSFHKVQPQVQAICEKYGINYHCTGFVDGTMEVVNRLDQVAKVARKLNQKQD
ncbi:hypothetical protein K7432_009183 [Basidiobolus ranarum]|uniref:Cytochrome b5 heme-binding domain-containing protein n=1 Tax=Basidiobolus ranarum TaxID=34480 RepID=A0ABR2VXG5_9FUNG